jgi:hypothetical protein
LRRVFKTVGPNLCRNLTISGRFEATGTVGEALAFHRGMERTDVERLADSVLRQYGVPLRVAGIVSSGADWTIAFSSTFPGAPAREIKLQCERASAYHVRESLKRSLELSD